MCSVPLSHTLKNSYNAKFYVMCNLPHLKKNDQGGYWKWAIVVLVKTALDQTLYTENGR